jgi:hypothetical protein
MTGNRHNHGTGVFRRGNRIGRRRIDDDNPPGRCRLDIDTVHADAGPADDFQFLAGSNDLFCHMGHRTGYHAVVFTDAVNQSLFIEIRLDIYFISVLAEQLYPFFRYVITYENFHCIYPPWSDTITPIY